MWRPTIVLDLLRMVADGTRNRTDWGLNAGEVACPGCGAAMPRGARLPRSWRQVLWGGWTCPTCGTAMDKWGRKR